MWIVTTTSPLIHASDAAELTHVDVGSVGELQSEVVGLDQVQMVENLLVQQRAHRSLLYTPSHTHTQTIHVELQRSITEKRTRPIQYFSSPGPAESVSGSLVTNGDEMCHVLGS